MDKYIGLLLDNRYEILEAIGTGGMAVVYRARCRLLNRYVAIKILKDEFASDADFRRRFHTEAQAVAKLQHPNIVSVYDVNRTDNIEYIVMELAEGITLKEYMEKKGALTPGEVLHFAPQIVSGLEHAHNRGIIHRDIKPQNIIILRDGSLKVTDFGIARFAQSQQVTLTDEALGSVHYVSPEQARGSSIDARSDIYSFGVMMYEMLTGRLPFEGDTPVAVVLQHINSIPLSPREVDPQIPAGLEAITMHAMAPKPENRYSTATEILKDFEAYQKNPDVSFGYAVTPAAVGTETMPFKPVQTQNPPETPEEPTEPENAGGKPQVHLPKKEKPKRRYDPDDEEEEYIPRRRTSLLVYIVTGILTAAIFLGGAAFIITTIFNTVSQEDMEELHAPNLVGKNLQEVLSGTEYSDFNIKESETMYSPTVPKGTIISQKPAASRTIKPDTIIYVTVSLGQKTVAVPDLINVEHRTAQLQLQKMDLVAKVEYELNETIVAGNVIRTEPESLTELIADSVVTLYVSLGKEEVLTTVPDLYGCTEVEAERKLLESNLVLGEIIPMESDQAYGTVVDQSIAEGQEVPEKTAIDIYLSSTEVSEPDQNGGENNVKGSFNLSIKLPDDEREEVKVTVKSGTEILHEDVYQTKLGMINITLRGSGSILAQVFFDDKFFADQIVYFD
ncbi:MAG: Stk1 family PASTA domain-containing Ser/Thr kinase [Ruminococcaceae bacterium]|nr:Stk1 family PASTA domain-containing Ser/Thr kinase [Oscillospiraceae bacterium]